jgi:hypothetical protein
LIGLARKLHTGNLASMDALHSRKPPTSIADPGEWPQHQPLPTAVLLMQRLFLQAIV